MTYKTQLKFPYCALSYSGTFHVLSPYHDLCPAAAAAAKSLQSRPTLCDHIEGSPLGSSATGILQARTLKWVAISISNAWKWKVKVKSLSCARLLATPWTAPHQYTWIKFVPLWVLMMVCTFAACQGKGWMYSRERKHSKSIKVVTQNAQHSIKNNQTITKPA